VAVQLVGALAIPALAALGPVRAAGNLTIREAFNQTGNSENGTRGENTSPLDSYFASRISHLVAWRNVGRRKLRLALTLVGLSLAGAIFIATFGLKLGLDEAIEVLVGEFSADVVIDFAQPEEAQQMAAEAAAVAATMPAIEHVETWGVADARRVFPDGRVGSSFTLYGVPPTTQIADFAQREGQWIFGTTAEGRRTDGRGFVICAFLYQLRDREAGRAAGGGRGVVAAGQRAPRPGDAAGGHQLAAVRGQRLSALRRV